MKNQIRNELTRSPFVNHVTSRLSQLEYLFSKGQVESALYMVLLGKDSKNEILTIHLDNLLLSYDCDIILDAVKIMNYAEQVKNVI